MVNFLILRRRLTCIGVNILTSISFQTFRAHTFTYTSLEYGIAIIHTSVRAIPGAVSLVDGHYIVKTKRCSLAHQTVLFGVLCCYCLQISERRSAEGLQ